MMGRVVLEPVKSRRLSLSLCGPEKKPSYGPSGESNGRYQ